MEELKLQAEALAEERRKAREQAAEWTREIRLLDSDDDKEKKPRRKRAKAEIGSGDEGLPPVGDSEPKKKRRGKLRKKDDAGGADAALFSGDEEPDKPARKVSILDSTVKSFHLIGLLQRSAKKRQVRDDEDDEEIGAPRRKQ